MLRNGWAGLRCRNTTGLDTVGALLKKTTKDAHTEDNNRRRSNGGSETNRRIRDGELSRSLPRRAGERLTLQGTGNLGSKHTRGEWTENDGSKPTVPNI